MRFRRAERDTQKINIIAPNHCSEIPGLHQLSSAVFDNVSDSCRANFQHTGQFTTLLVQVLHEGVMWRGLCPLLQIVPRYIVGMNHQHDNHQQSGNCSSNDRISLSHSSLLQRRRRFFFDWVRRVQNAAITTNRNENTALSLIIFPPYTSIPDFYTCSLFITWEHTLIRLQSLQAYTSTLGGGYFFCGQLHAAIELARYQRKLALALHDDHAAGICTVVSEKTTGNPCLFSMALIFSDTAWVNC
jgi:hypothetical protein